MHSYRFGFSTALSLLKSGLIVTQDGWGDAWIRLVDGSDWNMYRQRGENYMPFIYMKTAEGNFIPWSPSQTDILGEQWKIADSGK